MRWVYLMVIGLAVGMMSGCNSAKVYSDKVQGADLKQYKTYAWLPTPKDSTKKDSEFNSEITNQNIRAAVDKEMQRRGYTVNPNNPDLLLMEHTKFEERQETVRSPIYSSYSYYYPGFYAGPWYPYYYSGYNNMPYITGYDIRDIHYTEGTVVIDVIDRNKHQLLWRGWSEKEVDSQKDINKLYKNVEDIFEKYPVRPSKK